MHSSTCTCIYFILNYSILKDGLKTYRILKLTDHVGLGKSAILRHVCITKRFLFVAAFDDNYALSVLDIWNDVNKLNRDLKGEENEPDPKKGKNDQHRISTEFQRNINNAAIDVEKFSEAAVRSLLRLNNEVKDTNVYY